MLSDFKGAFAYYIVSQTSNDKFDFKVPLDAYVNYLKLNYFKSDNTVLKFTYDELKKLVDDDLFCHIPEILLLNQIEDFVDLGALARNVFYMIVRLQILDKI
jgi:hypothetical protein